MDTNSSTTQPPPPPPGLGVVSVGGVGLSSVIKKVGKPPSNLIVRDAVPMFQCALCGVRFHLVDDLVKHVEKGQHFDIDAVLDSGHEVRAGPSCSSSCSSTATWASTSANYQDNPERLSARAGKRSHAVEEPEFRSFARFGASGSGSGEGYSQGDGRMLRLRSCSSTIQRRQSEREERVQERFTERKPASSATSSMSSFFGGGTSDDAMSNTSFGSQLHLPFNIHTVEEEHDLSTGPDAIHPRELVNCESCPDEDTRGPTSYSFRPRKLSYYRCLKCSLTFDSASELKDHSSAHPLDCNYCDRSFLIKSSLDRHIQEEHEHPARNLGVGTIDQRQPDPEERFIMAEEEEQEEEFQLQDDGQGSHHSVGSIFESDVLIEALEGCYRCKVCRKECAARSDMQKHVRRHTDERPYSCYICSERFKHRSAITNHLRIHTGERPYSCVYCGKQFSQHSNKRRHEALHRGERPFRCVLCGRTFSEKTTLQTHMLQHTGERPFICEVCQKGHITKSALTRHKCIHKRRTGQKFATSTGEEQSEGGGSMDFDLDSSTGPGTDSASYSSQ